MSIPNIITIGRIVLVPLTIWFMVTGQFLAAFTAFIVAGISDGVDGFIAKRFNQTTQLGAYLDPLADKLLLVSIYLAFSFLNVVPALLVIIVVSRDVMIIGAVLLSWLMDKPVEMHPLWISKINTTAQILLAGLVLAGLGMEFELDGLVTIGSISVGFLTIASGAAYMVEWNRHMSNGNGKSSGKADSK